MKCRSVDNLTGDINTRIGEGKRMRDREREREKEREREGVCL